MTMDEVVNNLSEKHLRSNRIIQQVSPWLFDVEKPQTFVNFSNGHFPQAGELYES